MYEKIFELLKNHAEAYSSDFINFMWYDITSYKRIILDLDTGAIKLIINKNEESWIKDLYISKDIMAKDTKGYQIRNNYIQLKEKINSKIVL